MSQIPWGHNIVLFQKVKDAATRSWYAAQVLEHGWSRSILEHQIETDLYGRQGQALTNFIRTLPPPQSDLAQQVLKDPGSFDFPFFNRCGRRIHWHPALELAHKSAEFSHPSPRPIPGQIEEFENLVWQANA